VPRYNEIWFFYPRGEATECTDAIIYNVKDKLWYDAGSASGAQRSCGYTTEIFPTPIWAGWNYDVRYSIPYVAVATPATLTPPTEYQFYLAGDMTSVVTPGEYVTTSNTGIGNFHRVLTSELIYSLAVPPPGVTLVTVDIPFVPPVAPGNPIFVAFGGYGIWQHEFGVNQVNFTNETAILSSVTTCDISWVGGDPSQDTLKAINRRMHLRRIEPDFLQSGEMTLDILGRKFARGNPENSGPFPFDENTEKIDLRVENREMRLQFTSNTIDGNYEMGRILITAEYGDERP
jgi:hypothetical protein